MRGFVSLSFTLLATHLPRQAWLEFEAMDAEPLSLSDLPGDAVERIFQCIGLEER